MKIRVLTGVFHPESGGFSTYLYHLLPLLVEQGHDVAVLTFGEPPSDSQPYEYGYPVTRLSRVETTLFQRVSGMIRHAVRFSREADVLLVLGYVQPLPLIRLARLLAHNGKPRIILKIVGDYVWEYSYRNGLTRLDVVDFQQAKLPLHWMIINKLYHFAVRQADEVFVPSEHLARLVRGWGVPPHKVNVIYNGIPDPQLYGLDRAALRRELGLPVDAPLLVTIGRLAPVKRIDIALEALRLLPEDVQFVVVGEGNDREALEAMAPVGRVHFVGRQEHNITLKYLRAADLFVLSSATEGLAHVLLEAQIVGTPAVATSVGGNPEVVIDGENGRLVPPENPQALADAIRNLLDHPEVRQRYAEAGYARRERFLWGSTVQQTIDLLIRVNI
jgi:glycosyltransferase involved in cell wall biosynthesis